jgi:hypothetical protein
MTPRTHEQEVRCAKRRARAMNSLSLNGAGSLIPAEGYKSQSEIDASDVTAEGSLP